MENRHGFTLIELSIVLVIIGLIVGAIVLGQSLIRQAEIRSLISDVDKIRAAINTFKEKYNCLPGDCANATDFFGTASGGCPSGARSGTETCNGNGDGDINLGAVYTTDYSVAGNIELFLFWQHLANAGLWPGTYTGVSVGGNYGCSAIVGVNIPASQLSGSSAIVGVNIGASQLSGSGGYLVADFTQPNSQDLYAYKDYSRVMEFGATYSFGYGNVWINISPVLTGMEMHALDTKIDDGLPGSGDVFTYTSVVGSACVTGRDATTATYIDTNEIACLALFGKMWE